MREPELSESSREHIDDSLANLIDCSVANSALLRSESGNHSLPKEFPSVTLGNESKPENSTPSVTRHKLENRGTDQPPLLKQAPENHSTDRCVSTSAKEIVAPKDNSTQSNIEALANRMSKPSTEVEKTIQEFVEKNLDLLKNILSQPDLARDLDRAESKLGSGLTKGSTNLTEVLDSLSSKERDALCRSLDRKIELSSVPAKETPDPKTVAENFVTRIFLKGNGLQDASVSDTTEMIALRTLIRQSQARGRK